MNQDLGFSFAERAGMHLASPEKSGASVSQSMEVLPAPKNL